VGSETIPIVPTGGGLSTGGIPRAAGPMSEDFRFAAAVAEFAPALRDSPHKGSASYATAIDRATGAAGYDPGGHRAEFLRLVARAKAIAERSPAE